MFFCNDLSGNSKQKAQEYNANIKIASKNFFKRLIELISIFLFYKPKWCELYLKGRFTIFYTIFCKIFNAKLIVILRGTEFKSKKFSFSYNYLFVYLISKIGTYISLRMSDKIIYKEQRHITHLKEKNYMNKSFHIHNCVPIPKKNDLKKEKDIDILFLNRVIKMRNVELLLEALNQLIYDQFKINSLIIGFTSLNNNKYTSEKEYEKKILKKIKKINRETQNNKIKVKGFVKNPHKYFNRAKVFALPADVIFLNFSLLEAMSYKVAPVVINGEGANNIIKDKINGVISDKNTNSFKNKLIYALNNYKGLGLEARKTVKKNYSMEIWFEKMMEIRKSINNKS